MDHVPDIHPDIAAVGLFGFCGYGTVLTPERVTYIDGYTARIARPGTIRRDPALISELDVSCLYCNIASGSTSFSLGVKTTVSA
jgi:hypothetical protein